MFWKVFSSFFQHPVVTQYAVLLCLILSLAILPARRIPFWKADANIEVFIPLHQISGA